jgi:hypothetical protein
MQIESDIGAGHALHQMTDAQFLSLGTDQVVYLKRLEGLKIFMIYSANGMPLEAVDDFETAVARGADAFLTLVRVH